MNFLKELVKKLNARKFSRTNRYYFLFNVVLGLWTLFFFVLTRDTPLQQPFINALFDAAIEYRSDPFLSSNLKIFGISECDAKNVSPNIVLLTFDDKANEYLRSKSKLKG